MEDGTRLNSLASLAGRSLGGDDLTEVATWVTRLGQLVRNLYGEKGQHFDSYSRARAINDFFTLNSNSYGHFTQILGVAKAIKHDVTNGLMTNVKSLAQVEIFADFIRTTRPTDF
ncbi:MAG: hypothetical protein ACI9MU_001118 [Alphaproteobacteria bacterium]